MLITLTLRSYLIKMWPLPFFKRPSFFSCSTNVTLFLIVTYNPNISRWYVKRGLLASLSARYVLQPAEAISVKWSQPRNLIPFPGFQLQSRGLIYLNPERVLIQNVKQTKLQATLFTHFIEHHVRYTLHWHKMEKKKNLKQTIMALGWITWTHHFQGVLLNDISNAPNLCKYSEHRSEEVMVG